MIVRISNSNIVMLCFAAVLIVAIILFGYVGLRTIIAIALFFFLPFYLIFRPFALENDEKVFFAFFIGIAFFSTAVFYVGRLIPSYRAATAIAFVFLLIIPIVLKLKKRSKTFS